MPTTIVTKHSNTPGSDPTTENIIEGELALNTKDKTLWSRDDAGNIIQLVGEGGADHTHTTSDITDFDSHTHTTSDITDFHSHTHTTGDITNIETYVTEFALAAARPSISTMNLTSYTLQATDEYHVIRCTNANDVTVTVPPNADEAIPLGYTVHLHYEGTGTLTVAEGTGVTVNSSVSLLTAAQYSAFSLIKVDTDQWMLVGDQG